MRKHYLSYPGLRRHSLIITPSLIYAEIGLEKDLLAWVKMEKSSSVLLLRKYSGFVKDVGSPKIIEAGNFLQILIHTGI